MTVSAKGARRHSSRACDWRSLEGRKGSWLAAPAFVEGRSDHARSVTQNAGPRDKAKSGTSMITGTAAVDGLPRKFPTSAAL